MSHTDPRVDKYIEKSVDFARPILEHLRSLVHKTCPETKEAIKWSFPVFDYQGKILCNMAAHKAHCSFGFWLAPIMDDPDDILTTEGMGNLGKIQRMADLPSDKVLTKYIRQAMRLTEEGKTIPRAQGSAKDLDIPIYLTQALNGNKAALETFENFSYSNKKDYVEWLTEAKTEATREKRLATTLEWLAEGKVRNWKYIK